MERWSQVLDKASKKGVKYVNLLFTSLAGRLHAIQIPIREFDDAVKYGVGFDGSSVGLVGVEESDLMLRADPSTLRIAYWADPPIAIAVADIYEGNNPSSLDPRHVLRRTLQELKDTMVDGLKYFTTP